MLLIKMPHVQMLHMHYHVCQNIIFMRVHPMILGVFGFFKPFSQISQNV